MSIRVLHVLEDFSRQNTGVTSVVREITTWQANYCEWVGVYVSGSIDLPAPDGVELFETEVEPWSRSWRYPAGGLKQLASVIQEKKVDVVHVHGLWRASTFLAVKAALHAKVPVLLSVHGQTSSWALDGQGFLKGLKKKIYWAAVRKTLSQVDSLHAITPLEQRDMVRLMGSNNYSVVIPNAIDIKLTANYPSDPKRYFLFLGRLHPVKGVENLIKAFIAARLEKDWELLIAGPEEDHTYVARLKHLADKHPDQIRFIGPVYGQEKERLLKEAWALVAPSYTEVVGMVNLEAATLQTPSLTTPETGLFDWESGGGMLVSNDENVLRSALERTAMWSTEERLGRGKHSRLLVEQRYSLDVAGHQWLQTYRQISNKNKFRTEGYK